VGQVSCVNESLPSGSLGLTPIVRLGRGKGTVATPWEDWIH